MSLLACSDDDVGIVTSYSRTSLQDYLDRSNSVQRFFKLSLLPSQCSTQIPCRWQPPINMSTRFTHLMLGL